MTGNLKIFFLSLCILCISFVALAKEVDVISTYNYESSWNSKPSDKDLKNAQMLAKTNIWKAYLKDLDQAQLDQYLLLQKEIEKQLDDYIINFYVKDTKVDEKAKIISITARGEVNEALLFAKLKNMSAAGQTSTQEGSNIGYLITLRKEVSRKSFDTKETTVNKKKKSASETNNESNTSSSSSIEVMEENSSGGSTEVKSDITQYESANQSVGTQELDASFLNVFSSFGFEVTKYENIEGFCNGIPQDVLDNEFIKNNKISNKNKTQVLMAAKQCEMRYFVTGVATIQKAGSQRGTSNTVSNVSLSVEVYSVPKSGPPKTIASFSEQVSESGSTERASAVKALKLVSQICAKKIVDQLNAKGVN